MMRSPTLVSAGRAFGVSATRRSPGNVSRGTPTDNEASSAIQPPLSARGPPGRPGGRRMPTPAYPDELISSPSFLGSRRNSLHQPPGVLGDVVRREPELGHRPGARRRGAEVVEADAGTVLADPALPAEAGRRLDRKAASDRRGQDLVSVALGLGGEQVPRGHADDAGANAVGGQAFRGL